MSVAAIILIKENRLVDQFRQARAIARNAAQALGVVGASDGLVFHRLVHRQIIREPKPGVYYLDEPTWKQLRIKRTRLVVAVLLGLLAVAGLLYAYLQTR